VRFRPHTLCIVKPSADLIARAPPRRCCTIISTAASTADDHRSGEESGYADLPATDAEALGRWFRDSADSGSLERYLETFSHTVAVMQTPEQLRRVAKECALDLAADGVVYAESRFAPELHIEQGLELDAVVEAVNAGFREGEAEAGPRACRSG
jgi:adenosine deaminase